MAAAVETEVEVVQESVTSYGNGIVKEHIQRENRDLTDMLERLTGLKQAYDSIQLSRDIKILQDASRIQNMSSEIRSLMLFELQRRKLIKQVIDGERL